MPTDPVALWFVRHGQSEGNVARERAHDAGAEALDLADRDMDVPLSALGRDQAAALGRWLADRPDAPDAIVCSPYVRARQTAEVVADSGGLDLRLECDERLRERELGILDLLTSRGVESRFPFEAERRRRLGKFYHRPPGGESWVDVALRIRSLRDSLAREHLDDRVLVVTHEVVIVIWRYLLERLDEQQALALSREHPLPNCSLTTYERDGDGALRLQLDAWTVPMREEAVPVTEEHDAQLGPR